MRQNSVEPSWNGFRSYVWALGNSRFIQHNSDRLLFLVPYHTCFSHILMSFATRLTKWFWFQTDESVNVAKSMKKAQKICAQRKSGLLPRQLGNPVNMLHWCIQSFNVKSTKGIHPADFLKPGGHTFSRCFVDSLMRKPFTSKLRRAAQAGS